MDSFGIDQNSASPQKEFAQSLYQEYFEEASFLYEQRLSLLDDSEITWKDIGDFEERFEAHIDGLVVGGDLAIETCKQQAGDGDSGELHAAMRVFCRQNRMDLVEQSLRRLDPEDNDRVRAATNALNNEWPLDKQNELIEMLTTGKDPAVRIAGEVIGYRRIPAGHELSKTLLNASTKVLPTIIWSLGRLRERSASAFLNKYLSHKDEDIGFASALALIRMGEREALRHCVVFLKSHDWPIPLLGLAGERSTASLLLKEVAGEKRKPDYLHALGLLGDISAVDVLLARLSDAGLAESAAQALNLITGADIYEQVFIPEKMDEDELFEEEREKFKQGQPPTRPDGKPFGIEITRLSQRPDDWNQWWSKNRAWFNPNIRYRNGKPYSAACLLENLESEKSPRPIRQLAHEEFVIRYGVDFPFETDMPVAQQKQAIAKYAEWIRTNGSRFEEGSWYFAGRLTA